MVSHSGMFLQIFCNIFTYPPFHILFCPNHKFCRTLSLFACRLERYCDTQAIEKRLCRPRARNIL